MSDISPDEFDLDVRLEPSLFYAAGRHQIGGAHQPPTLFGDTCPCHEAPQRPTLVGDTCPCHEAPQPPTLFPTCENTCDPQCPIQSVNACESDTCETCGCNTSETCTEKCANPDAVTFGKDPMGCDDASGGDDTCSGCPSDTVGACDPDVP
jgi:hypothetical protein